MNGYDKVKDRIFMSDRFYRSCIRTSGNVHGNVLDIGCGQGLLIKKILEKSNANFVVGIDISPKLCSISAIRNPTARIVNADAENNCFVQNSFNVIFMTEVLEHLLEPQKALLEVARILKYNGKLVLTVPNRDWLLFEKYKRSKESFQPVDDHWYRVNEIKLMLSRNHF